MESFEKIMFLTKNRLGGSFCPIHLNHTREKCYGRCWDETPIDEYEFCIHVAGKTTLYIGEQVYYPVRGTVATFRAGEVHKQFVTSLEPYERYILWVDHDYISGLFDGAQQAFLSMFSGRKMFENNVIQLPVHQTERLLSLLEKAADYADKPRPEDRGMFFGLCMQALAILSGGYCNAIQKQEAGNRSPIVSMALELVEKQFLEIQSVEDLAVQLHISNSYLARIFKKQVGTSVYEYIQNRKLSHAVRLLAQGKNVTTVCYDSGFNNYSYFIQLFKRKYGVTPRKYQKSLS